MIYSLLYFALALILYGLFYSYTRDSLNPFGLSILCWVGCFAISLLYLNSYVPTFKPITHIVVLLVTFDIAAAGFLSVYNRRNIFREHNKTKAEVHVNSTFKQLCWFFVILSALCVVYLLVSNGYNLRSFGEYSSFDKKADVQVLYESSLAAYGAQFFSYTPILMAYILLYDKKKTKRETILCWIVIFISCFYDWFIIVSRGTMLVALLGILYLVNTKYKIHFKALVVMGILLIAFFGFLMSIRVNSASGVFQGLTNNPIVNSTYNYFAFCYVNLEKLLVYGSPYTIVTRTWTTLSRLLGIWDESKIINFQTLFYNATTFVYPFYHDLGIFGVIIYPFAIYLILGKIYIKSRLAKTEYSLIIAVFMKAICVLAFGNYFIGLLANDINYIITIVIVILSYGRRRIVVVFGNRKSPIVSGSKRE